MNDLLCELDDFRLSENFVKYGFSSGGKYNEWIQKAKSLSQTSIKKEKRKANILVLIAYAYVTSRGKDTNAIEDMRIKYNEIL